MLSHLVEVLLQGVWSSLTGGWFYDPHLSLFINTVHMYTWIFLFVLPFSFYIIFPSSFLTWFLYTLIIFLTFTIIKVVNYQLNKMFDRNKIIVNEKMIKIPKVKLKSNKKQSKFKQSRSANSAPRTLASTTLTEWSAVNRNDSSTNGPANIAASRADSLVTSLKTMDLIGNNLNLNTNLDTDSNLNVFNNNDINNSNLDTSISSSTRKSTKTAIKQADNLESILISEIPTKKSSSSAATSNQNNKNNEQDRDSRLRANSSKSSSSSSGSSNGSNRLENETEQTADSTYEHIKKKKDDSDYKSDINPNLLLIKDTVDNSISPNELVPLTSSNLNLDDQNLISIISSMTFSQKDIEENSNRSLFKISEESLHNNNNNIFNGSNNSKTNKPSKKSKQIITVIDHTLTTDPFRDTVNKNKKSLLTTTVTPATTVPHISNSSKNHSEKLETAQSSTWLNSNSYTELRKNSKQTKSQANTTRPLIRRAKSDLSFSLFEKIVKKSQLNFKNLSNNHDYHRSNSHVCDQDQNPNSIYESIDGESSKTLLQLPKSSLDNQNNSKFKSLKQSKTATELFSKYKYESENLEKKISFLTTQSVSKSLNLNEANWLYWKRLGAKSFHNLNCLSLNDTYQPAQLSLSQYIQYEDLKQFKTTLECIESAKNNSFSLESIKKRLLSYKQEKSENEYQSIVLESKTDLNNSFKDLDLVITQNDKEIVLTKNRSNSFQNDIENRKSVNRHRAGGRKRSTSKGRTRSSKSFNVDNSRENDQNVYFVNEKQSNLDNTPVKPSSSHSSSSHRRRHRTRSQNSSNRHDTDKSSSSKNIEPYSEWIPSSQHSRNLTLSASQAATAAAKIIKRDLFDRLKSNRGIYRLDSQPSSQINDDGNVGEDEDDYFEKDLQLSKNEKTLRFNSRQDSNELNSNLKESEHKSKQKRRSSKFKLRSNQLEIGLDDDLNKDSKLTPVINIKTQDLSNESDEGDTNAKTSHIKSTTTTRSHQLQKPLRSQNLTYETFMDIIQLNEEGLYENDDQLSENEYNFLNKDEFFNEPPINKSRNSRNVHYHHNNHYRFNNLSGKKPIPITNQEEIIPMNRSTANSAANFTRSRSVENRNYESYSNSARRHLIRSRLRFSNRRNQQRSSNDARISLESRPLDPIDINAYHVILPNTDNQTQESSSDDQEIEVKKKLYKLPITKSLSLQIPFDHFSLLAMLDKNQSIIELISTIIIATLVSIFSSLILNEQIYDDLFLVLFCFIIASCHYSLLKSVQPDSSSPIHGFNRLTALGRPIYFCLICSTILFLRFLVLTPESSANHEASKKIILFFENFTIYNFSLTKSKLEFFLSASEIFLLFFPLVFTLGLFPQISTFTLCVLEQIDMYLFGGTAMNSLAGAFLSVFRSLTSVLFLTLILFASMFTTPGVINSTQNESIAELASQQNQFSQTVLFSLYCAFLVVFSYSLSRQTSDLISYFSIFKDFLLNRRINRKKEPIKPKNENDNISNTGTNNNSNNNNNLIKETILDENLDDKKSNQASIQLKTFKTSSAGSNEKYGDYVSVPDSPLSSPRSSISSEPPESSLQSVQTEFKEKSFKSEKNASEIVVNGSAGSSALISQAPSTFQTYQTIQPEPKLSNAQEQLKTTENEIDSKSVKSEHEKTNIKQEKNNILNSSLFENDSNLYEDPFEINNRNLIKLRLESDIITCIFIFIFVFAIHVSTLFTVLRPWLNEILFITSISIGALNHYILPHLRLENPWYLFSQPLLKPKHWSVFEPNYLARLEWFEIIHLSLNFFEKNVLNVLVILCSITASSDQILLKFKQIDSNGFLACFIITLMSVKLFRNSFCEPSKQYKIFLISYLFNKFDSKYLLNSLPNQNETILFDLFFIGIILNKLGDFINKLEFVYVYTAPWQLPWGSAFHAFAQPLSAPHTSLLFLQTFISSLIGAPLMPLMGSAIFLLSYMRPVKFWEKNYKTKRLDNSNTRLQSQFDTTTPDSENLNSIFYEHLASVLQKSLCGDIMLGRWGNVQFGDFFVLSSDYLNCLVHIIETGNGFVTFQLRGLEFKGTYCQQRELEAITEDNSENDGFCCCKLGRLKYMLSFNAAFHLRWVAWSVISRKYIVDAYRIVDNDLSLIVNFYSLRRTLIDFYVKSAIYYSIKSPKLIEWLNNTQISKELEKFNQDYVDYDTCFDSNLDLDYDTQIKGLTIAKFSNYYFKWINHCKSQRLKELKETLNLKDPKKTNLNSNGSSKISNKDSNLISYLEDDSSYSLIVRFCFALSLVCRRALITACTGSANSNHINHHTRASSFGGQGVVAGTSNNIGGSINLNNSINSMGGIIGLSSGLHTAHMDSDSLSSFQHGYYTLFKGDIRIQSPKDEWVFNDMEILKKITLPAVRMGLRLHQDHFQNDSNDEISLYDNLIKFNQESVICYERDPIWRRAVLSSISNLLSLRHQFTEYSDQYKVVMLNKNFLSFRVIKINKECVRSFWAGQQHELIFLRNKNQERGSIQNAKQVLRNIINSSCDQPIGYPIYVSPLITSYSSTHPQISKVVGPEFKFQKIYKILRSCFHRIRNNCMNDCSGSADPNVNNLYQMNQSQNLNISYSTKTDAIQLNYLAPGNLNQQVNNLNVSNNNASQLTVTESSLENNKRNNNRANLSSLVVQKEKESSDSVSLKRPRINKILINENCGEKL